MSRGYFITGTDTGVGKTFVTSIIAKALTNAGIDTGVMKPVETGCAVKNKRLVPKDALTLKGSSGAKDHIDIINPYRFSPPLAPNIAARLKGIKLDLNKINGCYKALSKAHDLVLVEGAGGLLAPLTDEKTVADLALFLKLPLIIVAPSRIGVINHTLLTVECARGSNIPVKGIVLNNPVTPKKDPSREFNRAEIERLTDVPVLGELPFVKAGHKKKRASLFSEGSPFHAANLKALLSL
jgi:dethiobiotin synthetase